MGTLLGLLFLLAGAGIALVGLARLDQERRGAPGDPGAYLRSLEVVEEEGDEFERLLAQPFLSRVVRPFAGRILATFGALLPRHYRERIQNKLVHAGIAGQLRAEEIIALQVLGAAVGLVLALVNLGTRTVGGGPALVLLVALPVIGAQLPSSWLDRKVEERRDAILRDLPDTLDLLAISVEAGVGFEGALGVVCDNFTSPLADEFARTLREMELGLPRREALHNLKKRTEVPELSNFVLTLTQADALGMPIGRVLKTAAEEMRSKRQQWAREKAAKLPVKILFPLVLFIFPAIFVVLLGPAASDIGAAFG